MFERNIVKTNNPITLCIIKPEIVAANRKEEVIGKIQEKGFVIVEQKEVTFTEDMVRDFYKDKLNEV